jgi:hypothetical protein
MRAGCRARQGGAERGGPRAEGALREGAVQLWPRQLRHARRLGRSQSIGCRPDLPQVTAGFSLPHAASALLFQRLAGYGRVDITTHSY